MNCLPSLYLFLIGGTKLHKEYKYIKHNNVSTGNMYTSLIYHNNNNKNNNNKVTIKDFMNNKVLLTTFFIV